MRDLPYAHAGDPLFTCYPLIMSRFKYKMTTVKGVIRVDERASLNVRIAMCVSLNVYLNYFELISRMAISTSSDRAYTLGVF